MALGNESIGKVRMYGDSIHVTGQSIALIGSWDNGDWARAIYFTPNEVKTIRNGIEHTGYNGQTSLTGKTVTIVNGLITNIVG